MSRLQLLMTTTAMLSSIFTAPKGKAATPAEEAASALKGQMTAWNNQDLEGALAYYWNSDQMTWVNRKSISFGIAEFAKAMRSDFADRSKMGHYEGNVLHSMELAPDQVMLVLEWKITGPDGKRLMGGVSTQLWKKMPSGWKAVFEHAS